MTTPDVFETTSWRGLTVSPGGVITSAMGKFEWKKNDWTEASCPGGRHKAPGQGCTCGIYSCETWEQLEKLGYNYFDVSGGEPDDAGLIWVIAHLILGGKIIPSSNGVIRAERAAPLKVYMPGHHWRLMKPIRDAYGCEIGIIDRFTGRRTA